MSMNRGVLPIVIAQIITLIVGAVLLAFSVYFIVYTKTTTLARDVWDSSHATGNCLGSVCREYYDVTTQPLHALGIIGVIAIPIISAFVLAVLQWMSAMAERQLVVAS